MAAVLAACSPPQEEEQAGGLAPAEPADEPGHVLPPATDTFRYVGRWAESVEQCRKEAWTLTRDRLAAPEGIVCDFRSITKSPGGYAIDATCRVDGEEEDDDLILRFAESAKAMLVEGASSLPQTGLVYCGEAA
ncbi:hypothetical protein [Pelagerythrobacter rhizovicinus]|uniref:Uncharacterized protein n=1 Tax=Pelagerythrobacter rhizovicinus TaxID=2268576 RepID=A0A4Q2KMY7_9SPHN|nr:hypothetical protein [Pelagerythrobacter rhizovicinus]RXZ65837.1 hypothetical protein ETX26_03670 [Pelagerythrobacter rhizovicinus]